MNIFGTTFNYQSRLDKVRRLMHERDIDCVLVHQWVNQYYISGLYQHLPWYPVCHTYATEPPLIIFEEAGRGPIFLCCYGTFNGVKEGTWIQDVRAFDRESTLNVLEYTAQVLKEKGMGEARIGIEEDCITASTLRGLERLLPKAQFKEASDIFKTARVVKDPEEVKLIKEAVAIGDAALKVAMEVAKPGATEMEVQRAVEIEMKRRGGLREVETMCQSGIRTANYRAFASEWKKIEKNEIVTVDLGCVYKGYGCDLTRTWIVGKPTDEQKKIATDLYKVYERFLEFLKPGLKFYEIIDFARSEMTRAGYPMSKPAQKLIFPFQHFVVHGVGLGPFHDPPDGEHKEMVLEPGMVLSIQPSARHETYTLRFEDNVLITEKGIEILNKLPKELI